MTPETLPLLAASFACFAVLAFFARRNRRTGWVKVRMPMEDYAAVEANVEVLLPRRLSSRDVTNFTLQLAHLQASLAILADSQEANATEERYLIQ